MTEVSLESLCMFLLFNVMASWQQSSDPPWALSQGFRNQNTLQEGQEIYWTSSGPAGVLCCCRAFINHTGRRVDDVFGFCRNPATFCQEKYLLELILVHVDLCVTSY